jgi:hypothetical protein
VITEGKLPFSILHYPDGAVTYEQYDATDEEVGEKILGLLKDERSFKVFRMGDRTVINVARLPL